MSDDMVVDLFDEDLDPAEVEALTLALRRELLDLREVEGVSRTRAGPAPPGSRAVGLIELGSLVVSLTPTVEALAKVVGVLRGWLASRHAASRGTSSTMRITVNGQVLELTPTAEQQQALVDGFLRSAAAPGEGTRGP